MTENQIKWLLELQEKGVMFEMDFSNEEWRGNRCDFSLHRSEYRIPAQPIPDIPDWREVCRDMQSKGVGFEFSNGDWVKYTSSGGSFWGFGEKRKRYRIPAQPIPEWREDMIESPALEDGYGLSPEAQKLKEELDKIPHRDLQIQWHEDCIRALRTGEPMREWEYKNEAGYWNDVAYPSWLLRYEYRRKPRMVTYWHCVGVYRLCRGKEDSLRLISGSKPDIQNEVQRIKGNDPTAKFSPITETTVEISED